MRMARYVVPQTTHTTAQATYARMGLGIGDLGLVVICGGVTCNYGITDPRGARSRRQITRNCNPPSSRDSRLDGESDAVSALILRAVQRRVRARDHRLAVDFGGHRDRKSTRLNSSHVSESRMPSSL